MKIILESPFSASPPTANPSARPFVLDLKYIFTCHLLPIPLPSPWSQPLPPFLGYHSSHLTLLPASLKHPSYPPPNNLCAAARGIFKKCKSEHVVLLLPITLRLKITWLTAAHRPVSFCHISQHTLLPRSRPATWASWDFFERTHLPPSPGILFFFLNFH